MQKIILGSKSIDQDILFERDRKEKHKKHRRMLSSMAKQKLFAVREWEMEVEEMSMTLKKSKSAAKVFKEKQKTEQLRQSNRCLLKKIWNVEPSVSTSNNDRFQHVSGSNWNLYKKKIDQIKEENKLIGKKIFEKQLETGEFKKKLNHQIKKYIELRNGIRKFRFKRTDSQKKQSFGLKLEKIEDRKVLKLQLHSIEYTLKDMNPQIQG